MEQEDLSAAREELLRYLEEGEEWVGEGIVRVTPLREKLIDAGYGGLALNKWGGWFGGATWLTGEYGEGDAVYFIIEDESNPYNFEPGWYGVRDVEKIVSGFPEDESEDLVSLREYAIRELEKFQEVKARLRGVGKSWFSLETWRYDPGSGLFDFWLNPMDQRRNQSGHYLLDELEQWGDGGGPVVRVQGEGVDINGVA